MPDVSEMFFQGAKLGATMFSDVRTSVDRIKAMEEYVISENVCRSRMLLRYFGEKNEHNCGQCDVCLSHRATDTLTGESLEELKKKIAELLAQKPPNHYVFCHYAFKN